MNLLPNILLQVGIKDFNNVYINYGALGVLLLLLGIYGYYSFKENIRRDKQMDAERKEMIKAHAEEKTAMIERHSKEMQEERERHFEEINSERDRYHQVHSELLTFLRSYTHLHSHEIK